MTWRSETWGPLNTNDMIIKIKEQVALRASKGAEYRICTDSQFVSERRIVGIDLRGKPMRRQIPVVRFNAVLTVLYKGKGGIKFNMGLEYIGRMAPENRIRLETRISLALVDYLVDKMLDAEVPYFDNLKIEMDINKNKEYRSNRVLAECGGMVRGDGYQVLAKGDGTAALQAADRLTKIGTRRPAFTNHALYDIATWLRNQIDISDTAIKQVG